MFQTLLFENTVVSTADVLLVLLSDPALALLLV